MHDDVKPSEKRGGTQAGEEEIREKGEWARGAREGIVPPELGGEAEDAPESGRTTGSEEPATTDGIDTGAGDNADATAIGGQKPPEGVEPDLKDVGAKRGS
jgi:hypothetical protein